MSQAVIRVGFMPLVDCAALVVADELGFARRHGVELVLQRENSWAALRDKLALGYLDGAHMLAGLTLALHLGLQGVGAPMVAAMSLGRGGNAITLAPAVVRAMELSDPSLMLGPRPGRNRALARVARESRARGQRLRLASVHPFSSHHYELREWLADGGIDPDAEVELLFIPPPRMVESLLGGEIDGFCAGEPWNQAAVRAGCGEIVVTKSDLWPEAPEKVLALDAGWLREHRAAAAALVRGVIEAGRWADDPANRSELARMLSGRNRVGVDAPLILAALEQRPWLAWGVRAEVPGYHRFHAGFAQYPCRDHPLWLLARMARWGQLDHPADRTSAAALAVYDPALYLEAAAALGEPLPPPALAV